MASNKKSRVYSVFSDNSKTEMSDVNTMKVKGSGKRLSTAQETISNLLEETKSYDIFTASSRLKAKENVMANLRTNRPDKPRRDAILNQVRINAQFNVST